MTILFISGGYLHSPLFFCVPSIHTNISSSVASLHQPSRASLACWPALFLGCQSVLSSTHSGDYKVRAHWKHPRSSSFPLRLRFWNIPTCTHNLDLFPGQGQILHSHFCFVAAVKGLLSGIYFPPIVVKKLKRLEETWYKLWRIAISGARNRLIFFLCVNLTASGAGCFCFNMTLQYWLDGSEKNEGKFSACYHWPSYSDQIS